MITDTAHAARDVDGASFSAFCSQIPPDLYTKMVLCNKMHQLKGAVRGSGDDCGPVRSGLPIKLLK